MRHVIATFCIGFVCILLLLAWELVQLPARGLGFLLWGRRS
jgi:hypothetical protein